MPKLNQVIAASKDVTSHAEDEITAAYRTLEKSDLFLGQTRVYASYEDEGETLPSEHQNVQTTVAEQIDRFIKGQVEVLDITATRNWGNALAKADVVVDGHTVLKGAPVEYLLFLETRLKLVATFLKKVPTLDPAFRWTREETDGFFHGESVQSVRTKQVLKNHVKAEATQHHPAQVETYADHIPMGTWTTTKISGAVPATVVTAWQEKLVKLIQAVKFAREEANSLDVQPQQVGKKLLEFIFS